MHLQTAGSHGGKDMKSIKTLFTLLLAVCMLASVCCTKAGSKNAEYAVKDEKLSFEGFTEGPDRVFYEIFVGSFSDSDGDGVGDLRGIIDRMDYLNDGDPNSGLSLGVEGLE